MRFHGNYCGPNWSNGIAQPSVVGDVPAVDEFDNSCRLHDAAYANDADLLHADLHFATTNFGRGAKETVAAVAVGVQAAFRAIDKFYPRIYKDTTMRNQSLRGSAKAGKTSASGLSTVPAAYGYTLRMAEPKVVRKGDIATISGSDFASSVFTANSSNYEPAASVCITPAYFQNAMLGSLARTYEKFRVKKAVLEYIPAVPTSTQGQIIMTSTSTVKEPFIQGNSSTFLSRALSQGNAVASPIWKETYIEIPSSNEWSIVDLLLDSDLDDCIPHEVQVYATCEATLTAGILVLHYEMEFKDPLYVFHPTLIPVPKGNGTLVTFVDNSAVNLVNDAIRLTGASIPFTETPGSVFRLIFQQARSTLPGAVTTWDSLAKLVSTGALTTSAAGSGTTNIGMVTGTVLYGLLDSDLILYASYDEATNGGINGAACYRTATTSVGTYSFIVEQVRMGGSTRITTQ